MEGGSPSVLLVRAQSKSRRLAAKACWAAWVRMADQRERREASTALRRMLGTALALVWAKRQSCCFRAPPAPCFDGEDHEPAPSGTEKFWVCALLGFACVLERCSCVLAGTSSGLAGGSQRRYQGGVDRELRSPPQWESMGYNLDPSLSSCRLMWSKLRSLRRVLVVTLAPASRQTLAAALSKGIPRPRKTPAWAHAARWSPNGSKMRRHRQMRADRGSGRRRRRRSRTRKR